MEAEAYEACLEFRSLVSDFLNSERRSDGCRPGPKNKHELVYMFIGRNGVCRPKIMDLKRVIREVSGPRKRRTQSKALSAMFNFYLSCDILQRPTLIMGSPTFAQDFGHEVEVKVEVPDNEARRN